jgi:hypothetical protein
MKLLTHTNEMPKRSVSKLYQPVSIAPAMITAVATDSCTEGAFWLKITAAIRVAKIAHLRLARKLRKIKDVTG